MRSKDACPVREPGAGSKISLQGAVSDHALEFLLKNRNGAVGYSGVPFGDGIHA